MQMSTGMHVSPCVPCPIFFDGVNDPCRHIKTVMEGQPHKLLESVAERLASEIMNEYHQVQGLQLHIKKPHVAVTGVVESLGKTVPELPILLCACKEAGPKPPSLFFRD